jgi:hypothetical protein
MLSQHRSATQTGGLAVGLEINWAVMSWNLILKDIVNDGIRVDVGSVELMRVMYKRVVPSDRWQPHGSPSRSACRREPGSTVYG